MQEWSLVQSELSDEALIARVQQRDVVAFSLLYDRYAQAIYALAAHLLSHVDAEEIVQDTFLRLWNRAEQYDASRGSFRTWFITIARHCVFDELKRRNHEQRSLAVNEIEHLLSDAEDLQTNVAEEAWLRQRQDALIHALRDLPAEQRRALVLAYFGGLSQSAIAQELGLPLGTVKKRIRLGLQKLRTYLMPWREIR